ncbi:hypothetical protein [Nocardioides sp. YIM 152588]|uniref:hypothetical protein n=1 Tax=Nocardioides sp. YIM 152588 TaxID=3158259 RepID=UPI0032E3DEAF
MADEWEITDEELDAWYDEWKATDRAAAEYLADRIPGVADDAGEDDARWLDAVAATIRAPDEPEDLDPADIESLSAVSALQHADWLGLTLGIVRRGPGAAVEPEEVLTDVNGLDDVEGEIEDPEGFVEVLTAALRDLTPRWQALGVLDPGGRLTERGVRGLPRALHRMWSAD